MKSQTKPENKPAATPRPTIYVTRDIERALGMEPGVYTDASGEVREYFIIANRSAYAETILAKYPNNIWLVGTREKGQTSAPFDTFDIMNNPEVRPELTKACLEKGASILVFKNTSRIETLAREHKWNLLNPDASLAETIENKITQVAWLGDLARYLPEHSITLTRDITAKNAENTDGKFKPFIVQWAHSHTGDGTILVSTPAQLALLQKQFPDREARVTEFVNGPVLTMNIAVGEKSRDGTPALFFGNLSYQITGALPFTENPWSTIGNDWSLPHSILTETHLAMIDEIAHAVTTHMTEAGWKGLFGIDLMLDQERDVIRLIEINARQPASTTYESQLQLEHRKLGVPGMTIFEAHLNSLMNQTEQSPQTESAAKIILVNDGSQIVQRITITTPKTPTEIKKMITSITNAGYTCIPYENTKSNSDLLRIQSSRGIMEAHNKFNKRGKEIIELITQK